MPERTFAMIKPDAFGRRLAGEILGRYEAKGLKIVGLKMQIVSQELAEKHYDEHRDKPFFRDLVQFITSGPTVQIVLEGNNAIETVRTLNGATNCQKAAVGTIRGDLGMTTQFNLVHASDSPETAAKEIALYFSDEELWSFGLPDDAWLHD